MTQINELFIRISALFTNLFQYPDWRNIVDVVILIKKVMGKADKVQEEMNKPWEKE